MQCSLVLYLIDEDFCDIWFCPVTKSLHPAHNITVSPLRYRLSHVLTVSSWPHPKGSTKDYHLSQWQLVEHCITLRMASTSASMSSSAMIIKQSPTMTFTLPCCMSVRLCCLSSLQDPSLAELNSRRRPSCWLASTSLRFSTGSL
jgi:hypothetical protein